LNWQIRAVTDLLKFANMHIAKGRTDAGD